jgi:hypothetical protein
MSKSSGRFTVHAAMQSDAMALLAGKHNCPRNLKHRVGRFGPPQLHLLRPRALKTGARNLERNAKPQPDSPKK